MDAVERIDVELKVLVGAAEMPLSRFLELGRGAVIPLGRDATAPLSILANGHMIAPAKVKLIGEQIAVEIAA